MRKSDERLRGSCLLIRNMRRLFAIFGDSWPIFPFRNPSIIQLITPPPPSLIFRIIGLRTFSLQIIEPQRFTQVTLRCDEVGEAKKPHPSKRSLSGEIGRAHV